MIQHLEKVVQHREPIAANRNLRRVSTPRVRYENRSAAANDERHRDPVNLHFDEPAKHMFTIYASEAASDKALPRSVELDKAIALDLYKKFLQAEVQPRSNGIPQTSRKRKRASRSKNARQKRRKQEAGRARGAARKTQPPAKPHLNIFEWNAKKTFCFAQFARNMPMERPIRPEPTKKQKRESIWLESARA